MLKYNCSFYEALKYIRDDFNAPTKYVKRKESNVQIPKKLLTLKIKKRDYTDKELLFWNHKNSLITKEVLESWGIYCVDIFWENETIHYNCQFTFAYVENGKVNQIYSPNSYRKFINASEFKIGHLEQLEKQTNEILVITKSKKDSFFLNIFGIPSIYIINEAILIDRTIYEQLKTRFTYIYTLFDNDSTGKRLSKLYYMTYKTVPLFTPIKKDFYEWYSEIGCEKIKEAVKYFKDMKVNIHLVNKEIEIIDKTSSLGIFSFTEGFNEFDVGFGLELQMNVEGDDIVAHFYKNSNYDFPLLARLNYIQ